MMKTERWCFLLFFLVCASLSATALQASPQEALEEIATADKIDTVIKHLPVKVQEYVKKLPAKDKAEFAEKLLMSKNLERAGGKLTRSDTATAWEVIEKDGAEKTLITFKNTYISGTNALVELEIKALRHTATIFVGMRLEEGEWRIHQVGNWQKTDLEEELLRKDRAQEEAPVSEMAAASTLRTLNTAIITYMTTYPDQGCPASLKALSGSENQEATPDHAMLVDPTFVQEPLIKNGYQFQYVRLDQEHYQITATPANWDGESKSLFTDDTAVIRFTAESRPANANDRPIE